MYKALCLVTNSSKVVLNILNFSLMASFFLLSSDFIISAELMVCPDPDGGRCEPRFVYWTSKRNVDGSFHASRYIDVAFFRQESMRDILLACWRRDCNSEFRMPRSIIATLFDRNTPRTDLLFMSIRALVSRLERSASNTSTA